MPETHDVGQYYNNTQNHYRRWWRLKRGMSLHYGIWDSSTRTFLEALMNTNRTLKDLADIQPNSTVLDAGCGVGGAAIYLAQTLKAKVSGITMSEVQVQTANTNAAKHNVTDLANFSCQDYTATTFKDATFSVVWACESLSSANNKAAFAKEANRLLAPNGKIVLSDFFRTSNELNDPQNLLSKWCDTWAMAPLITTKELIAIFEQNNFELIVNKDYSAHILPTARRMYRGYLIGALPSIFYNLIFGASRYARTHYLSGKYQYLSLKKGLWQYHAMVFVKKSDNIIT